MNAPLLSIEGLDVRFAAEGGELRIGDEKVWGRDDEVWGRDDEVSEIDPVDGCDYYINNFMKLITEIVEEAR